MERLQRGGVFIHLFRFGKTRFEPQRANSFEILEDHTRHTGPARHTHHTRTQYSVSPRPHQENSVEGESRTRQVPGSGS